MRRTAKVLVLFVLVLLGIRLMLPSIGKKLINQSLAKKLTDHEGHIEDFDLSLWRGAYQVQGLFIRKKGQDGLPLLQARNMDFSVAWRALLRGQVLVDLRAEGVEVNFIDSQDKKKVQTGKGDKGIAGILASLTFLELESLLVTDSEAHFRNYDLKIPLDVRLTGFELETSHIGNRKHSDRDHLPSPLHIKALLQGKTPIRLDGQIDLTTKPPRYDLDLAFNNFDLTSLNPLMIAYGPVTFTSGKLSVYAEAASRNDKVKGYVRPFFEQVDVIRNRENFISFKHFGIEILTAVGNLFMRNSDTKDVATKLEFQGQNKHFKLNDDKAWDKALENAFGTPMKEGLEHSIDITDV